jgi:hypothetical protein
MANVLGIIFSTWLQNHRRSEFKASLEEARIREELYRLASIDDLTGILNRRKIMQFAAEEFEQAKRNHTPLSVLMIDIDHSNAQRQLRHKRGDLPARHHRPVTDTSKKWIWGGWARRIRPVLPGTSSGRPTSSPNSARSSTKESPRADEVPAFPSASA